MTVGVCAIPSIPQSLRRQKKAMAVRRNLLVLLWQSLYTQCRMTKCLASGCWRCKLVVGWGSFSHVSHLIQWTRQRTFVSSCGRRWRRRRRWWAGCLVIGAVGLVGWGWWVGEQRGEEQTQGASTPASFQEWCFWPWPWPFENVPGPQHALIGRRGTEGMERRQGQAKKKTLNHSTKWWGCQQRPDSLEDFGGRPCAAEHPTTRQKGSGARNLGEAQRKATGPHVAES